VTLAHDLGRGNRAAHRSAVKLQEIGPRVEMQLVKVEEGLCSGKVMFHEFGKPCCPFRTVFSSDR
jgi:ribosome biogenesis protein SSF1/2